MTEKPPQDPAALADDFAHRWADKLDRYCAERMEALGLPPRKIGASDRARGIAWCAFNPHDRDGGNITTGDTVNSGAINPDLLKGKKGGHIWPKARLRDRIDAIIAHEWEEDRHGTHAEALKAAARTELTVSGRARWILRAMAR